MSLICKTSTAELRREIRASLASKFSHSVIHRYTAISFSECLNLSVEVMLGVVTQLRIAVLPL